MIKMILATLLFSFAQSPNPKSAGTIEVVSFTNASWINEHTLQLSFKAIDHHTIYKTSLELLPAFGSEITFKNTKVTPVTSFYDKYSNVNKEGVTGQFQLTTEVYALKELKNEAYPLVLSYQACSDEYCLFPQNFSFHVPMYIKNSSLNLNRLISEGLVLAMIFVFFAGFLTSLTPCIFPMIPITLAVLIPRGRQLSFSQKLRRSLSYVFGIAITYSLFGLLAASTGQMFGSFLGNFWVACAIGIFFTFFGISMLGFFELRTPHAFTNSKLFNSSNTFVFGLAAGVVAGPCVGPVLLSILTYISQTGDMWAGFALMMSFAFGMGLIFIVLGVSGNMLSSLPRSGRWLNFSKFVFAGSMFFLAIYYVRPIFSAAELSAFTAFIFATISCSYAFFYQKRFGTPLKPLLRTISIVVFGVSTLIAVGVLVFARPINATWQTTHEEHGWVAVNEAEMNVLLKNGKPTIIDFYADWCLSCKELKAVTFSNEPVIQKGNNFNRIVLNATTANEFVERLKAKYHVMGLPTLLFFNKNGEPLTELTLTGFESPENFLDRMNRALH